MYFDVSCMYLACNSCISMCPIKIHQDTSRYIVSGVVDVMDSIVPDGSPAFIGSHNQPGDELL